MLAWLLLSACSDKGDSVQDTAETRSVETGELCFVEHFVPSCPGPAQAETEYFGQEVCTEFGYVEIATITTATKSVDAGSEVFVCCYETSFVVLEETCDTKA